MTNKRQRIKHSLRRANSRFALALSVSDISVLKNRIHAANGVSGLDIVFLERQSQSKSIVAVKWQNDWLPVVFSRTTDSTITILPAEYLDRIGFVAPRQATAEEMLDDYMSGKAIRRIIFGKYGAQ